MRACREILARHGFTSVTVYRRRLWKQIVLNGTQAERHLDEDEQTSDQKGYWWTGRVCWSRPEQSARVIVDEDYDGNDLSFVGWGEGAEEALSALAHSLPHSDS